MRKFVKFMKVAKLLLELIKLIYEFIRAFSD